MKRFSFFIIVLLTMILSGCVTGDKFRGDVREGMSKQEVISVLGNPDGVQHDGDYEAFIYSNRLISGWSWDRTDYTVIFLNGKVDQYGPGKVRQEGPKMIIVVPIQ